MTETTSAANKAKIKLRYLPVGALRASLLGRRGRFGCVVQTLQMYSACPVRECLGIRYLSFST